MTRVSDVAPFCDAVEAAGALPFLALAMLNEKQAQALMTEVKTSMGTRSWGVGILGFVDRATREAQLRIIEEVRPPFAIIAGGRPDQAAKLESLGVSTYLHAPSPRLLESFIGEGARRFVFEGRECGGHVGPRSSFVLWETMIQVILAQRLSNEELNKIHVLFAGGIHDARSASMVAALAQPLVERGVKIGVLVGTAYLFTKEAVETGAVVQAFQDVALEATRTEVLETGPGHAIRCARSEYTDHFLSERTRMRSRGLSPADLSHTLERMHTGRLRIASKGIRRAGGEAGPVNYETVEAGEQLRNGMYMLGQVAAFHSTPYSMQELHHGICKESAERLARIGQELTEPATPSVSQKPFDIAIVGIGALMPGACDAGSFWQLILGGGDSVGEIPPDRFDYRRWFNEDNSQPDTINSKWGGFLDDIPFDPLKYGIPPTAIRSIEPVQLLALVLVDQALNDAGYHQHNKYSGRTSVILGAGGGLAELGAGYTVRAMLPQFLENPGQAIFDQLPDWTEDSFAGILLNVISGRVSNRFDLRGVNYTVDAACASSLAAVYLACQELERGASDMVLAGGCDTVQNPLSYLCFARSGVLSPTGRSRTFSADADGIVISEGLAAVVLKRREDAVRDGDRIYAVIRGAGGASDGRQRSLTAPTVDGQRRTIRRAYDQAGYDPATVQLFEAHGTGTKLGDPTECEALRGILEASNARPQYAAIGSVKSNIGHTKAAAGIAGLIKTALAVYHRVLPATLHVTTPNPKAGLEDGPLFANVTARPWITDGAPRRAGISSFGFGGTNFHVAIEEFDGDAIARPVDAPIRDRMSELFVIRADDQERLLGQVRDFRDKTSSAMSRMSLAEWAYWCHSSAARGVSGTAAALVVSSLEELQAALVSLEARLEHHGEGEAPPIPDSVYWQEGPLAPESKIAFLFPGQGAQFLDMMRALAIEFYEVRTAFEEADNVLRGRFDRPLSAFIFPPPRFSPDREKRALTELTRTDIAQPALGACGVGLFRLLRSFGLGPSMAGGHSYGELVALHAANAYDAATLFHLSHERGAAIMGVPDGAHDLGRMLAVAADGTTVRGKISSIEGVWVANVNGPRQIILSGTREGIEAAKGAFDAANISSMPLSVACAFHSPLVAHAKDRFAAALDEAEVEAPSITTFNNATASEYPPDHEETRRLLADNLVREVQFMDQIYAMYEAGARIFVEVGPGNILTELTSKILAGKPHLAVATQIKNTDGITQLHRALAALIAHGVAVDCERLYEGRNLKVLDLDPERPGQNPHLWLVNGGYARPASEPKRSIQPVRASFAEPTPSLMGPTTAFNTPAPDNADVAATAPGAAFSVFQQTMRQFLSTQEEVWNAFAQTRVAPGAPPPRVEQAPSPEAAVPPETEPAQAAPQPDPVDVDPVDVETPTDTLAMITSILTERTGYPADMLEPEALLEADLGIDSIKRTEVIATGRRQLLPQLKEPPAWFVEQMSAAASIREIVEGLDQLAAEMRVNAPGAEITPPAKTVPSGPELGVPRCVAKVVAAPPLDDAHPRSDGVLILAGGPAAPKHSLETLLAQKGHAVEFIDEKGLSNRDAVLAQVERIRAKGGPITAVIHLAALGEAPEYPGMQPGQWRDRVGAELKSLLFVLQAVAPELDQSSDAHVSVFAVTQGGGDFSLDDGLESRYPWRGGITGLLKTAAKEWTGARFRSIDCDRVFDAAQVLAELNSSGPVEIGYRNGRRLTVQALRDELEGPGGECALLSEGSVVLATGGAKGITAKTVVTLAKETKATFILLGRSAKPQDEEPSNTNQILNEQELRAAIIQSMRLNGSKPAHQDVERELKRILGERDIRATLQGVAAAGGRAEYVQCDVLDEAALEAVVRKTAAAHGGIDALIHGAGIIEDASIAKKSELSFDNVLNTKVLPLMTLARLLDPNRLKLCMIFSSVAGFYGNIGQCDYAAANEITNRIARRLQGIWPGKVVAMNWGPWRGAGMVTPEVARQFEERGIGMVSIEGGCLAAWKETNSNEREVRILIGPGPWVCERPDTAPKNAAAHATGARPDGNDACAPRLPEQRG